MSQVTDTTGASGVSFMCVTGQRSPQLALAMLMLNLADTNKKAAMDGIKEIETQQAEKKAIADLLNQARDYKSSDATKTAGDPPYTSSDFNKAVEGMGFSIPNETDNDKNNAAWDKVIAQLQTKMDSTGADIQTKMVQLQDMMGQYNSYTSGANSAIAKSNDILSSLARGQ
ncbi:MAG: USH1C-binding protein 1 [Desulfovibrio sp.]|nr:USH1C-binding protein 1 [Desulfovibrio sp.]